MYARNTAMANTISVSRISHAVKITSIRRNSVQPIRAARTSIPSIHPE